MYEDPVEEQVLGNFFVENLSQRILKSEAQFKLSACLSYYYLDERPVLCNETMLWSRKNPDQSQEMKSFDSHLVRPQGLAILYGIHRRKRKIQHKKKETTNESENWPGR